LSDPNFPDEPALRPIPEFCRKYRVGRDYVYEQIRGGALEAVKVSTRTHITAQSEKSWLASLPRLPQRPRIKQTA
jgi:hypothetical protein